MPERRGFRYVPIITIISEENIAKFCSGCDKLKDNNFCADDAEDQGRYVARGYCGWATQNSVRGQMTNEGFKPSSNSRSI